MNEISKVKGSIQIGEFAHLTQNFSVWYNEYPEAQKDRFWKSINEELEEKTAKLVTVFKKDKTVSGLQAADALRDEKISALYAAIDGYKKLPIQKKAEAAKKVSPCLDKYRGISRLDFATESTQIASLLEDLAMSEIAEALGELDGVGEIVEALKEAEKNFLAEEKALTIGKTEGGKTASELRKQLLSTVNDKLIPYLNVAVLIDEAVYGEIVKKVSLEVNEANSKIAQRAKKTSD